MALPDADGALRAARRPVRGREVARRHRHGARQPLPRRHDRDLRGRPARHRPPWGIFGGHDGINASMIRNAGQPDEEAWPSKVTASRLAAGDTLQITVPNSGGYGDPLERDPELVLADVLDGFTTARARRTRLRRVEALEKIFNADTGIYQQRGLPASRRLRDASGARPHRPRERVDASRACVLVRRHGHDHPGRAGSQRGRAGRRASRSSTRRPRTRTSTGRTRTWACGSTRSRSSCSKVGTEPVRDRRAGSRREPGEMVIVKKRASGFHGTQPLELPERPGRRHGDHHGCDDGGLRPSHDRGRDRRGLPADRRARGGRRPGAGRRRVEPVRHRREVRRRRAARRACSSTCERNRRPSRSLGRRARDTRVRGRRGPGGASAAGRPSCANACSKTSSACAPSTISRRSSRNAGMRVDPGCVRLRRSPARPRPRTASPVDRVGRRPRDRARRPSARSTSGIADVQGLLPSRPA